MSSHTPPAYHESIDEPSSPTTRTVTREPPSYEADPALPATFKIGKNYTPPLITPSAVRKHLFVLGAFQSLKRRVEAASYDDSGLDPVPGPAVKWALYLLRANHRFRLWLERIVKKPERVRGELGELTDAEIPPLDVLLAFHAYLLNPVNYYEDTASRYPLLKVIGGFPLDRVGGSQMKRLGEKEVVYVPTPEQVEEWEFQTQEAFELALVTTLEHTVDLTCPMCGDADVRAPWLVKPTFADINGTATGTGYAQSGFSVECQNCHGVVTKHAIQAERFAREFVRVRDELRRGNEAWFVNSLVNVHTGKPSPAVASNFAKLSVDGIAGLDENPALLPHIALGSYVSWDLSEAQRLIEAGFRRRGNTRAWMGDSISRMMRAFRHNSPVSLDVVGAAMRQFRFISQMERLGWTDKLHFGSHPEAIVSPIIQYHRFLDLFERNPSAVLVPNLVVDLGWHTHMLNAEAYQADCMRLFQRYLNHEDKVEEGKLASSFEETAKLWKSRFGESYVLCGCSPSQTGFSNLKLKFWKKPLDSKTCDGSQPPDAATHPTDHNSIFAVNPKKAVAESRYDRVTLAKSGSDPEHPRAFVEKYQPLDAQKFSAFGLPGWDIDCVRQAFVVDSNEDRGDCCVGVHISCSTISYLSATGEAALGGRPQLDSGMVAGFAGMQAS